MTTREDFYGGLGGNEDHVGAGESHGFTPAGDGYGDGEEANGSGDGMGASDRGDCDGDNYGTPSPYLDLYLDLDAEVVP